MNDMNETNDNKNISFKKRFLRAWIISTVIWVVLSIPMGMFGDMMRSPASAIGGIFAFIIMGFATSAVIYIIKAVLKWKRKYFG